MLTKIHFLFPLEHYFHSKSYDTVQNEFQNIFLWNDASDKLTISRFIFKFYEETAVA